MFWAEIWEISEFFIWKFSVFGCEIFYIFEQMCFCNVFPTRCCFVLCSCHSVKTLFRNLCFEQKYEKYQSLLSENFQFLDVKFSIYLNRCVFVMSFRRGAVLCCVHVILWRLCSAIYVLSRNMRYIRVFYLKIFSFWMWNFLYIWTDVFL